MKRELTLKRFFNAPKKTVYTAWTEAEKLKKWWGPTGFSTPVARIDARPGGEFYTEMEDHAGNRYPMTAKFTELMPHDMLAFTFEASHGNGVALKGLTTATFADHGKGTLVALHTKAEGLQPVAEQMMAGMEAGWSQSFDKMAESLEGKRREFVIERTFDAPRDLVWEVYTDAKHLAKWWGPVGMAMTVVKFDFRPSGTFIYGMNHDGNQSYGKFYYRWIYPKMMQQFTVSFCDKEGNPARHPMAPTWPLEMLNTLTFEAKGDKTLLIMRSIPINATEEEHKTFQDGFASMQGGFKGSLDQLEAYLNKVK